MRVVTFKVEEDLLTKLDLYTINKRLHRSEVIRMAIERFLLEEEKGVQGRLCTMEL